MRAFAPLCFSGLHKMIWRLKRKKCICNVNFVTSFSKVGLDRELSVILRKKKTVITLFKVLVGQFLMLFYGIECLGVTLRGLTQ